MVLGTMGLMMLLVCVAFWKVLGSPGLPQPRARPS
jgi:hypothetical protein